MLKVRGLADEQVERAIRSAALERDDLEWVLCSLFRLAHRSSIGLATAKVDAAKEQDPQPRIKDITGRLREPDKGLAGIIHLGRAKTFRTQAYRFRRG